MSIPQSQPLAYNAATRQWCYGCGCGGKRACFTIPDDYLVIPIVYGQHILDGRQHNFQPGYLAICATAAAAAQAVERRIARRVNISSVSMTAMRAF